MAVEKQQKLFVGPLPVKSYTTYLDRHMYTRHLISLIYTYVVIIVFNNEVPNVPCLVKFFELFRKTV